MSELAKALLAFQKEAPNLHRTETGQYDHRYVSLDAAMSVIRPLLNEHGVVVQQEVSAELESEKLRLQTTLTHAESGQAMASFTPIVGAPANMQQLGSAITYARRYGLMAMLGLVAEEDDDGQKASEGVPKAPARVHDPSAAASQDRPGGRQPATPSELDPDAKPTPEQIGKLYSILQDLVRLDGEMDWNLKAKLFIQNKLNKENSLQLSLIEYEALITHMEGLRNKEEAPFS